MTIEKILKYDTEDFILDDDFLKWVLHPDKESDLIWSDFLEQHPEKKEQVKEAVFILKALQPVEQTVPQFRLDHLPGEIKPATSPLRKIYFIALKYAAVLILLISIGGLIYFSLNEKHSLPVVFESGESIQKGQMILADGSVFEFETEQTSILQTATGKIAINNDTVVKNIGKPKTDTPAMNQIVIPYGKRSEITLADGTHIWLNSGSQISYPATFASNSREVYLSGEAFFDVKSDHSKPFYVITKDIKLRVTGTRFDVSSYSNDKTTQAVLLAGKVSAGRNQLFSKTVELMPGERIVYNKQDENLLKDKVDVNLFSSWINGYLIFENEPVNEIFKKLERYYNRRIVTEQGLDNITFSGKLDLIEDIGKVLDNISFSSSFSVSSANDIYTIKP